MVKLMENAVYAVNWLMVNAVNGLMVNAVNWWS
jgi:hypothetical protein